MEPVRHGRDDEGEPAGARFLRAAAMEPVRHGRDDATRDWPVPHAEVPQWSPSVTDGMTMVAGDGRELYLMPQWSPSVTDGMTRPVSGRAAPDVAAAIEPVRHGRDDGVAGVAPEAEAIAAMEPVRHGRDDS